MLVPGGRLGLIWNGREEQRPWQRGLTEIMEPYRLDAPPYRSDEWRQAFERTTLFTHLEHARFGIEQELDADGVVDRVLSVSFMAALPDDDRAAVADEVRGLLARDPEARGRARVSLPYRTDVFWCERV